MNYGFTTNMLKDLNLKNLTVFCAICNVHHAVSYRCAALRKNRGMSSPVSFGTATTESAKTGAYRAVR